VSRRGNLLCSGHLRCSDTRIVSINPSKMAVSQISRDVNGYPHSHTTTIQLPLASTSDMHVNEESLEAALSVSGMTYPVVVNFVPNPCWC
jgi:hypothetical protein